MRAAVIQPAAACALCGSTGGTVHRNTHRPGRISLARFGVPEVACNHCYNTARYRWRAGLDVLTGERKP